MLTIGKLARRTDVSTDTIRFYEKEGLLNPSAKSDVGYRLYDKHALRRLRFIRQAQRCGFSLTEIRELLALKAGSNGCCGDVRSVAIEKKLFLEHKIKTLKNMSLALSGLIEACNDDAQPLDDCPILSALESTLDK